MPRRKRQLTTTKGISETIETSDDVSIAVMARDIQYIKENIDEMKTEFHLVKAEYATRRELAEAMDSLRDEIKPVRQVVYGAITIILIAVVGAIVSLVIRQQL